MTVMKANLQIAVKVSLIQTEVIDRTITPMARGKMIKHREIRGRRVGWIIECLMASKPI